MRPNQPPAGHVAGNQCSLTADAYWRRSWYAPQAGAIYCMGDATDAEAILQVLDKAASDLPTERRGYRKRPTCAQRQRVYDNWVQADPEKRPPEPTQLTDEEQLAVYQAVDER